MAKSIRFKVGMQVKVNSDKTGVGISNKSVADMGFKKGETVELIKYDSRDETWEVKSLKHYGVRMWIKRKNLAPIEAEPKTMRALCLDARLYGGKLIEGKVYTVREDEPIGPDKFFEVLDPEDGVPCRCWQSRFKIVKEELKVKAVDLTDTRGWKEGDILSKDILNDGTYRDFYGFTSHSNKWTSMECKGFYGSDARTIEKIKVIKGRLAARISDTSNIWVDIKSLPVKAEPKPVETPKKEVVKMKCVDAVGWRGYLTLGKTYEVELDPKDSGSVRVISPDNPYGSSGDGSMRLFKNRFELAETPKKRVAVCVNMDGSFETSYMVGKVYEIYKETSDYYYLAEVDGKRYEGGMFKWRFKEIDKQEPNTVDKTFTVSIAKDKLAAFDKELQALVAKYK